MTSTVSCAVTAARSSMFSASRYAHGNDASCASVKVLSMRCAFGAGTVRYSAKAPSRSAPRYCTPARSPSAARSTGSTSTRSPIRDGDTPAPNSDDQPARVRALDARKDECRAGPACVLRALRGLPRPPGPCLPHGLRIPADPRVDVGVVDASRADLQQHLPGRRSRHGHVVTVVELLEAAVAFEQHRLHGSGNHVINSRGSFSQSIVRAGNLPAGSRNSRPCRRRRCAPR